MANVAQIMSFLNAAKGSTMRFTLGKNTLQQLASQADDKVGSVLQTALSRAKNPTVEVAAKASKQGFTIAGMVIKDGEKQIGRGAVSVTGFGKPDAVWKTKLSLLDGNIQAGGGLHIGKSPDMDNIAYNIVNRNGRFSINGVGNNGHSYALVETKNLADMNKPGLYNELIGKVNQPMSRFWQGFRNWTTGEGSFGWWKTDKIAKFEKLKVATGPDKFKKIKTSAWKLKDGKTAVASNKADDVAKLKRINDDILKRIKYSEIADSKTLANQEKELAWATKRAKELGIDISDIINGLN